MNSETDICLLQRRSAQDKRARRDADIPLAPDPSALAPPLLRQKRLLRPQRRILRSLYLCGRKTSGHHAAQRTCKRLVTSKGIKQHLQKLRVARQKRQRRESNARAFGSLLSHPPPRSLAPSPVLPRPFSPRLLSPAGLGLLRLPSRPERLGKPAKLQTGPVHGNLATCALCSREGGCASFTKRDTIKQNAQ